jgi:Zn-dependent M28 family amino/carboxypeptidase
LGKRGDVVFNGADDDGSGTVSVIEMAEAFAEAKKKEKRKEEQLFL